MKFVCLHISAIALQIAVRQPSCILNMLHQYVLFIVIIRFLSDLRADLRHTKISHSIRTVPALLLKAHTTRKSSLTYR